MVGENTLFSDATTHVDISRTSVDSENGNSPSKDAIWSSKRNGKTHSERLTALSLTKPSLLTLIEDDIDFFPH